MFYAQFVDYVNDFFSYYVVTCNDKTHYIYHMPKVIINGPESSGKTTISEYLVREYNTRYLQEYPRLYLEMLDRPYTREDLMIMAEDISDLVSELHPDRLWIIDTDIINIKIWYEHKYGASSAALAKFEDDHEALHLLCKPDIPWIEDPLRENEYDRDLIFEKYIAYYNNSGLSYHILEGDRQQREEKANNLVSRFSSSSL